MSELATDTDQSRFHVVEGKPIRFLALAWSEDWEFDHPTVVLEPVFCYSPCGDTLEYMIENAAIDLALDGSRPTVPSEGTVKEFEWRGWSIKNLRRAAKQCLQGKRFPKKNYRAVETWFEFYRDPNGELMFRDAIAPL